MPTVPLIRALSKRGLASRKDAREMILAGRVRVDGRIATRPTQMVSPERARIEIDGVAARPRGARRLRLIAFHKPRGVITTRRDPEGRRTVFDVIGDDADGLIAVGRLDRASTGLLLLTNDTELANRLTDPGNRLSAHREIGESGIGRPLARFSTLRCVAKRLPDCRFQIIDSNPVARIVRRTARPAPPGSSRSRPRQCANRS